MRLTPLEGHRVDPLECVWVGYSCRGDEYFEIPPAGYFLRPPEGCITSRGLFPLQRVKLLCRGIWGVANWPRVQVCNNRRMEPLLVLLLCTSCCSMLFYPSFNAVFSATVLRIRLRFDACTTHTPEIVFDERDFRYARRMGRTSRKCTEKRVFSNVWAFFESAEAIRANPFHGKLGLVCVRGVCGVSEACLRPPSRTSR